VATTTPDDAERARALQRALFVAAADEVVQRACGLELRTPSLPLTRDLNSLYAGGELTAADVAEAASRAAGPEWGVYVGREDIAEALAPALASDGWARERGKLMGFAAPPPEPDPRVERVDRAALRGLRQEWLRVEMPRAEVVAELLVADERLFTRTPTRAFGVRDGRGTPVAMTLLVGAPGPVRMVEDVYTTPAARRRGHASALVRTAVATALAQDAELVFLPTATTGPAQDLYARLGFGDLCRTSHFWRAAVSR